jgi:hypothetical protein
MRITSTGDVGVGTTAPSARLTSYNGSNDYQLALGSANTFEWKIGRNNADGKLYFQGLNGASTVNNVIVADLSGNVGIGTASPTGKLNIKDSTNTTLTIQGDTGAGATFINFSADAGNLTKAQISGAKNGGSAGDLIFSTANSSAVVTERARIIQSGTMYLGYNGSAPVLSGADVQGLSLTGPASTLLQMYMLKAGQVEAHFGFNSSDTNLYVGTGGGIAGVGTYGLYQANTGTTWTSVSDERFKTELQPIENALDKIANVRAVTGRYTYDAENGRTARRSFLIAQDFVTALPEAVDEQNPDKLGLSYSDTIPLLYAAIKEQQALITQLQADVAALKAQ